MTGVFLSAPRYDWCAPLSHPSSCMFVNHGPSQHQGMDRPGVRQVPEGSGEEGKMEKAGCEIICGAPTTFAVRGLMMIMINRLKSLGVLHPKLIWVRVSYYMAKPELKICSGQHNQQNNAHLCIHVTHCNFRMAYYPFTMFSEITIWQWTNTNVSNHKHA